VLAPLAGAAFPGVPPHDRALSPLRRFATPPAALLALAFLVRSPIDERTETTLGRP